MWESTYSDEFLADPEDIRFHVRYIIANDIGDPIGRLHVNLEPRYSKENN